MRDPRIDRGVLSPARQPRERNNANLHPESGARQVDKDRSARVAEASIPAESTHADVLRLVIESEKTLTGGRCDDWEVNHLQNLCGRPVIHPFIPL